MKFLHLGDLHLGKSLGDFDLIEDQKYILDQILELAVRESVDAILIAGDVYDKAIPSEAATRLLDSFLNQLAQNQIKVFMVSGNHDSDDRLNYGSALFASNQIYISAVFDGTLHRQSISDGETDIDIYMLPFVKASQVRHFFPDEEIKNYEDAVRSIIRHTEINRDSINILVAHQFVAGKTEDPALAGSESVGTQSVGLVEKIGYDCFDLFDYVALGHIHSPQRVGRDEVRYAGAPLKYSLSEAKNEKSVPLVTVSSQEKLKIELVPLKPMRDLRHIRGRMAELLPEKNEKISDDFIYATLTDEEIIDNAMGIFQRYYPNTVRIDYDNSHTRAVEQVDISRIAENKSFAELIGDFYRMIYGCEISEEEMDVMRTAAREAGILLDDETELEAAGHQAEAGTDIDVYVADLYPEEAGDGAGACVNKAVYVVDLYPETAASGTEQHPESIEEESGIIPEDETELEEAGDGAGACVNTAMYVTDLYPEEAGPDKVAGEAGVIDETD